MYNVFFNILLLQCFSVLDQGLYVQDGLPTEMAWPMKKFCE